MQRLVLGMVTALVLVNGRMAAQQQDPRLANATAQAKQKLGLVVFPAKNQAPEQQAQDEQACYAWAQQQVDPLATAPNADSAAKAGRARADSAQQGGGTQGSGRRCGRGRADRRGRGRCRGRGEDRRDGGSPAGPTGEARLGGAGGTAGEGRGRGGGQPAGEHLQEGDGRLPAGEGLLGPVGQRSPSARTSPASRANRVRAATVLISSLRARLSR